MSQLELLELKSFLDQPDYDELRGFVFAVASAPALIPPTKWLPQAFGGELPQFEDAQHAKRVMGEVMELYHVSGRMTEVEPDRDYPVFRDAILDNLEMDAPVGRWSHGFTRGHCWLEEAWGNFIPEELEQELGSQMMILSFFSSRKLAETFQTQMGGDKTLEEMAMIMRDAFFDAMIGYAQLGRSIYVAGLAHDSSDAKDPS